jgi:ribosomal protein S6--L-glutamate ligase
VHDPAELEPLRARARRERTGFLLQQFVPTDGRTLRVVIIGRRAFSYWRIPAPGRFHACVSRGAAIEADADPALQARGRAAVQALCASTRINLAGFDLIFPSDGAGPSPLFLEINFFFGRRGLGGSERYYRLLEEEIRAWLRDVVKTGPR